MLPSGLPEDVSDEEKLARFLTQSNQFNTVMAKPAAFLPNPTDRETSVSRYDGDSKRLWEMGQFAAGARNLYGAAILKARDVRLAHLKARDVSSAQLAVVSDEPPPYHAVIQGWPWNESDPELQKARQKELAALLASAAGKPTLR